MARGRSAVGIFILVWLAFATWAMATPLYGAPDEPAHVLRAASVARGELIGKRTSGPFTRITAPALYQDMADRIECWTFKPDRTPECMGRFEGSSRPKILHTYVGRYNPAYYLAVGWPSRFWTGGTAIYVMRLLSAAIAAALVTVALWACRRSASPAVAMLGIGFALMPTTVSLAGTVNPMGVEIAAAVALWSVAMVALDAERRTTGLIVAGTLAAAVLAVCRGLSPLWVALAVGLAALAVVRRPRTTLLGDRRLVGAVIVVAVVGLFAVGWTFVNDALEVLPIGTKMDVSWPRAAGRVLGATPTFVEQLVGVLQWTDTKSPLGTHLVWYAGVGALAFGAVVTGRARAAAAVVACALLTVLSPLLELPGIRTSGAVWQARYSLPLAVGVPILAGHALAEVGRIATAAARRMVVLVAAVAGGALVAAFVAAGRRNTVGVRGPLWYFGREDWHPPVAPWVLALVFTAAVAGLVASLARVAVRAQQSCAR